MSEANASMSEARYFVSEDQWNNLVIKSGRGGYHEFYGLTWDEAVEFLKHLHYSRRHFCDLLDEQGESLYSVVF